MAEHVALKAEDHAEHARRNAQQADLLEAYLAQHQALLVVALEPGVHVKRREAFVSYIADLSGVELVVDANQLPTELVGALLGAVREARA